MKKHNFRFNLRFEIMTAPHVTVCECCQIRAAFYNHRYFKTSSYGIYATTSAGHTCNMVRSYTNPVAKCNWFSAPQL